MAKTTPQPKPAPTESAEEQKKEVDGNNAETLPVVEALDEALKMALEASGWPVEATRADSFRSEFELSAGGGVFVYPMDSLYLPNEVSFGCRVEVRLTVLKGQGPRAEIGLPNGGGLRWAATVRGLLDKAMLCCSLWEERATYRLDRLARGGNKRAQELLP